MDAINYTLVEYLESLIDPQVKILDMYVHNEWLVAVLSSGVHLMIKNKQIV